MYFFMESTEFVSINGLLNKANFLGRAHKLEYFWTADWTADWITNPWTGPGPDHFCTTEPPLQKRSSLHH